MSDLRTVTQDELNTVIQTAQNIAGSAQQSVQSGQFVFFAAFDGTNNDRSERGLFS